MTQPEPAPLEALIRRDRLVVSMALSVILLLSWIYLLCGAGMGMTAADMTRMVYGDHSVMSAGFAMPTQWTPAYALLMFSMWFVMMVAMMLPSAAPVVLLAARINRHAAPRQPPFGSTQLFLCGYLAAWAAFSALATALQWALQSSGWMSAMMLRIEQPLFGALLLLAVAIWQLTPIKQACLRHCRSPAHLLVAGRERGVLRTGVYHGAYCIGCCWVLMALLFYGGVMNLFWIVGLALVVLGEKLLPAATRFPLLLAAAAAAGGIVLLIR